MEKRAVVISCFHYYPYRVRLILDQLRAQGYACTYLIADFDHITKKHFIAAVPDVEHIHTLAYEKNLSIKRIRSHQAFSCDAMRRVEALAPDLLYVLVPPNTLAKLAARYKKQHPQTKLIFDLYDLWPETFPSDLAKLALRLPFAVWRRTRDGALPAADRVYTECALFQQVLADRLAGKDVRVLPLTRPRVTAPQPPRAPRGDTLTLCYLGSINNIIDIATLSILLQHMAALRPVKLHVIGDGEARETLLNAAKAAGAQVEFHGYLYEAVEHQPIFDQCHFGINVMKSSVCVGLTMKSLDYFAGGLPVINTIAGDTRALIKQYGAGVEVDRADLAGTARRIADLSVEENERMRQNAVRMFEEKFSESAVRAILADLK